MRVWSDSNKLEHCRSLLIIFSTVIRLTCELVLISCTALPGPIAHAGLKVRQFILIYSDSAMLRWLAKQDISADRERLIHSNAKGLWVKPHQSLDWFFFCFYIQLLQSVHLPRFSQICVCCVARNSKWSPPAARVGNFNLSCGCRMV